jgi:hypothetical protein
MVVIDQADAANTCAGQVKCSWRSKPACANDERMRLQNPFLPFNTPFI